MRTHALQVLGVSLALSFLGVSFATAAGAVKVEPSDGFMKGANPEWAAGHAYGKTSNAEHRAYHKNGEAERVLWLREHASSLGTQAYRDVYRAFTQKRNLSHRLWHLEKSGAPVMREVKVHITITIISVPQRMSRRSLVNQTVKEQTLHSLTVGH